MFFYWNLVLNQKSNFPKAKNICISANQLWKIGDEKWGSKNRHLTLCNQARYKFDTSILFHNCIISCHFIHKIRIWKFCYRWTSAICTLIQKWYFFSWTNEKYLRSKHYITLELYKNNKYDKKPLLKKIILLNLLKELKRFIDNKVGENFLLHIEWK